ncbi:MAG: SMC-Scp complex subunit ScpB, partial [Bacteroidota bacterium]
IYATSRHFMDYFGINSADELPKINEVLADQVIPTLVNAEHFEVEADQLQEAVNAEEIVSTETEPSTDTEENTEQTES